MYGSTPLPTMLNGPVAWLSTACASANAASCSCTNCISGSWPIITGATTREKNRVYMFDTVGPRIGANRSTQISTCGMLAREPRDLALGADLVVDEPRVAMAAELGILGQEVRVLRVRAVDQRRRHHHEPARLDRRRTRSTRASCRRPRARAPTRRRGSDATGTRRGRTCRPSRCGAASRARRRPSAA